MRQILYVSSKVPTEDIRIADILVVSRRKNAAAGISGLLYADETRFLQVLEGESEAVSETLLRIRADPRHHAIVVLSDRDIEVPEFGDWAMSHRNPTDAVNVFDGRMDRLLANASPNVRGTFLGFVAARRAA